MVKCESIGFERLMEIANDTARACGFQTPDVSKVAANYKAGRMYRLPVIVQNANGILWVDKYYVAYQLGTSNVHYTYVTMYHIAEEQHSWRKAGKAIPRDIVHCFAVARVYMKLQQKEPFWMAKMLR